MIKKEKVQHLAKLARLRLSSKEIEELSKDLSLILNYIEKLKKIDISNIEPTFHSLNKIKENVWQEDKLKEIKNSKKEKLRKAFSNSENNYLKTNSIL